MSKTHQWIFCLLPLVSLLLGKGQLKPQNINDSESFQFQENDYVKQFRLQDYLIRNQLSEPLVGENPGNGYSVGALKIPKDIHFAGEPVPIDQNDVKERLDRELLVNTYWQSNMILMIKRGYKYFPIIEEILRQYDVPEDFKYLALIESGFLNATSPAGARGFWQIMKNTAREYGLEVNSNVDERLNLELATHAACKYFLKAKKRFGNWTLVAASYNRGIYGIDRALKKQKVDNYYDLWLNEETSRYVFRILAVKDIFQKYDDRYGFDIGKEDRYRLPLLKKVIIDSTINDLVEFSTKMGMTYKELKIYNPWLIQSHLNNSSRKEYEFLIPKIENTKSIEIQ
ncbi:MAG: lytic transglycosylase domain-containing protein [Flavobacteriaceae bacterium]|nr:lytic transglycosylase domain-containing protein [Flavobacteriaceae bacterium]